MKTFDRRLRKLEDRLGITDAKPRILYIVSRIVQRIGLDRETCIQILDEGGFLRKRGYMSVDLGLVPDGLSAEETKRFLLENGAKICPAGAWGPGAPGKECDGGILSQRSYQQTGISAKVKNIEAGANFHIKLNTG
jgi:hypothetical protein